VIIDANNRFLFICSFFACPKNEPKKGPQNANFSLFGPLALHAFTRTKKAAVRTILGLASARQQRRFYAQTEIFLKR
jgi:hypothetical protein